MSRTRRVLDGQVIPHRHVIVDRNGGGSGLAALRSEPCDRFGLARVFDDEDTDGDGCDKHRHRGDDPGQHSAAAPPRCREGLVDRLGMGDRHAAGVLRGDRASVMLMLGGRRLHRLRDRCRRRARPFENVGGRDAFRDRASECSRGIGESPLSTLGGLQFGKSCLSRRISRDVRIRSYARCRSRCSSCDSSKSAGVQRVSADRMGHIPGDFAAPRGEVEVGLKGVRE
jgi:hypothetical protein